MKNEKGLSILEVIWSILIISSILSTCFTYQIHYNKKVKTSILEKVILIEYYQIVEIFKVEYKDFNETFIHKYCHDNLYEVNHPYLKSKLKIRLEYNVFKFDDYTKYELKTYFPDEFKNNNIILYSDKVDYIINEV